MNRRIFLCIKLLYIKKKRFRLLNKTFIFNQFDDPIRKILSHVKFFVLNLLTILKIALNKIVKFCYKKKKNITIMLYNSSKLHN